MASRGDSSWKYYIKDFVYGANDGIVTTFAIVAGVVGADLSHHVVMTIGLASLVADGFSMAASNYLGSRSQVAVAEACAADGEPAPEIPTHPVKGALVTLVAFLMVGLVPLLPYLLGAGDGSVFLWTAAATGLVLFTVGALRTLVTRRGFLRAGGEMVLIGGTAAVLAYGIGYLVGSLGG